MVQTAAAFLPVGLLVTLATTGARAQVEPAPQEWDYAGSMKAVAGKFHGKAGVVLHVGDSITYSNLYGVWARAGQGQTAADRAVLRWMHTGANDETDGWWLARVDQPGGDRSFTACSGIRADEMLAGGKRDMPPLRGLLDRYRPQMIVLMLGTNDATARRDMSAYRTDMEAAVDLILDQGVICILSTTPPHPQQTELALTYNRALRKLAQARGLPLIDYEREILSRRPHDWNGTLLQKDDVHPTVGRGNITPASAPTAENLRSSGFLLRGWLSVQKVAEVKRAVLDKTSATKLHSTQGPTVVPVSFTPPAPPPAQPTLGLPVTRDTWFSEVGSEADASLGGASKLKLKSIQEMSVIDIDPASLKGRVVQAATLHLQRTGDQRLRRVTVSSFGAEWVEGTSPTYEPQNGSSSFHRRRHPDVFWSYPGSDLCSVMLGQGGTTWRMAEASSPDAQGWQAVAVDPAVVAARVADLSSGFLLFDDTGSEWTRQGETFRLSLFPNRFVKSRESGSASAPYLTVSLGPEDHARPGAPRDLRADVADLPAGEAWISWVTPKDEGPAGTLGFFIRVDDQDVPRYLIPRAGSVGERVQMHLRDLDLRPGADVKLSVRAVDAAGNVGPAAEAQMQVSSKVAQPLPGTALKLFSDRAPLPKLGEADVTVIDELDKVQPITGELIPAQPEGYLAANHLWSAKERQVRLHAARNEFVGFQILLRGNIKGVQPTLTFQDDAGAGPIQATFGKYVHVVTRKGPLPDPIVPGAGAFDVPDVEEAIPGQKSGSLYCELYVPHEAKAGEHKGRLILKAGDQTLALNISVRVWDFTLPDFLSFVPEMNSYGLPRNERDYYRLAHRHRTVINRVPYSQNGTVAEGCAPGWDGQRLAWAAWDKRFGPYLDGSAFADLPRKGVPIECFYLPMHENWPSTMEGNYNGDYWADRAFPAHYRQTLVEVSRQFAEHCNTRGWNETLFQFFLNGKNNFKAQGWSRGSSPWLLDEPANFQDYWALRYFGLAFHEGIHQAPGKAKLVFRCDISRPQWQRDSFDGLLDYLVVSSAMRPYNRIVLDRKQAEGQIVLEYGSSNPIEEANVQPLAWCIDSWSLGSDGVVPWQTIGTDESWRQADPLSLFYPSRAGDDAEPIPSIRLKAYRRGQQDVEYLTLLAQHLREPRWAISQRVREALRLSGVRRGTGFSDGEDAGVVQFGKLRPQDVWALRVQVGQALSEAHPAPKRKLVELRTPPRDPSKLTGPMEIK
jgi:hypothetical protein